MLNTLTESDLEQLHIILTHARHMPPTLRSALMLHLCGCTTPEIAAITHTSKRTTKNRIKKAILTLKKLFLKNNQNDRK